MIVICSTHKGFTRNKFNEEIMMYEAGHAALDWGGFGLVNELE